MRNDRRFNRCQLMCVSSPPLLGRSVASSLLLFISYAAQAADPRSSASAELQRIVTSYRGRGHVALSVQNAATGESWFDYNADRPQRPASVMKLFVTAAALERFGPEFKFVTRAYLDG